MENKLGIEIASFNSVMSCHTKIKEVIIELDNRKKQDNGWSEYFHSGDAVKLLASKRGK